MPEKPEKLFLVSGSTMQVRIGVLGVPLPHGHPNLFHRSYSAEPPVSSNCFVLLFVEHSTHENENDFEMIR